MLGVVPAHCLTSFPLDCCGGFAGDVIDDAVDAADLVYDSIGDDGEHFVRDT